MVYSCCDTKIYDFKLIFIDIRHFFIIPKRLFWKFMFIFIKFKNLFFYFHFLPFFFFLPKSGQGKPLTRNTSIRLWQI